LNDQVKGAQMKKTYTAQQLITISDLQIETSGFGSNSDCPIDVRGQVDDFMRVYAKQRATPLATIQVRSLRDAHMQTYINGKQFSSNGLKIMPSR
jgi:hypothetical protein